MFVLCRFSHFWLLQNLKLWKKMGGFFFHVVRKSVESPGNYVQYLSGMLLLGNQNTNRRFKKGLSLPKSQGRLQIMQYMIWEGHGCLRVIFFFITVLKRSNGNRTPFFFQMTWELGLLKGRYWLQGSKPTLNEGQLCVCVFSAVVKEANNATIS